MNDRIRALNDQISDYLVRMDIDPDRNDEGIFVLKYGSTAVLISLFEDGPREGSTDESKAYVRLASALLSDARPELGLVLRLLRMNTEVLFGAFQLFEDNTVSFTHTLFGDTLGFDEFKHALEYVARVSDDHDEELQEVAGGARVEDVLSDKA
jgi:hypothetical protein